MAKIAFLGLGVMGYPMAGHIAAAGHEVTVYNRTGRQGRGLGRPAWWGEWRRACRDTGRRRRGRRCRAVLCRR